MSPSLTLRATAAAVAATMLAGCTTDPYTGERQISKTAIGAVLGSAAGAGIGALADRRNRARGALIGAGVGALAGGAVGGYMDLQEKKLRERLQGTGVSVTRVGDEVILNMPGNVTFATDSANLNSGFYDVLGSVALVLKEFDKTIIEVTGHTDSTGADEYNQRLSEQRASAVGNFLVGQQIMSQRVITEGFGELYPVADNNSPQGRQQNRRVELRLVPLTQG